VAVQRTTLYTVGHGTRAIRDFIAALQAHAIRCLADVRMYPGSRRNPQFGREALARDLQAAGIAYAHEPALGGRRRGLGDASPNGAWRNEAFRAYADFMLQPQFWQALDDLLRRAAEQPTGIMCAETLWWRCHRRLIADAAVARGATVLHILAPGNLREHELSPPARIAGPRVTYVTGRGKPAVELRSEAARQGAAEGEQAGATPED
jgi:uncharacterized protein (DUF488 family)